MNFKNAIADDPKASRTTRRARMLYNEAKNANRDGNGGVRSTMKREHTRSVRRSSKAAIRESMREIG